MPVYSLPQLPAWADPKGASVFDYPGQGLLRQVVGLLGLDDPSTIMSTVGGPMEVVAPATGGLVAAAEAVATKFPRLAKAIKAYHGSPHDFEQFSTAKIGTGEGAQAYGHGLYFAEEEATAKAYRDNLKAKRPVSHSGVIEENGQYLAWAKPLNGDAVEIIHTAPTKQEAQTKLRQYMADKRGRMYEVAIKADPEHFLDWDKPLSQQSPEVRAALAKLPDPKLSQLETKLPKEPTGKDIYEGIGRRLWWDKQASLSATKPAAAAALKEAGIPGIKYLDQGSRAAGEGSRNYVVFDDKLVDILKKYGLAGAAIEGLRQTAKQQGGTVTDTDIAKARGQS